MRHGTDGHHRVDEGSDPVALRSRALEASALASLLVDPTGIVPTIVWANDSFGRLIGYGPQDVLSMPLTLLEAPGAAPFDFDAVRAGLDEGDRAPVTWRMLNARSDGGRVWCEYSLAEVVDDDGVARHWALTLTDVTEEIRLAAELHEIEQQMRANQVLLTTIGKMSALLDDIENPVIFREICAACVPDVYGWAGFFVDEGGLRLADGVAVAGPLGDGGTRLRRRSVDALGDSRVPGGSVGALMTEAHLVDPLRSILDGSDPGPLSFVLDAGYPPGTAAEWLSQQVRHHAGLPVPETAEEAVVATIDVVAGRRKVHGLFVSIPPAPGRVPIPEVTRAALRASFIGRVGTLIDTARLYAREHQLAETLQRAMLPEHVEISGLDVWTYYAPTSDDTQVGGDWYDIVQIDDEVAGLVVGDVVGHDIEAAATMGQLRSVVRSYAFELTTPGPVLERVDQLVVGMRIPRSASLVYGTLRRTTGPHARQEDGTALAPEVRWRLEYSRAGHLPPLLVRHGRVIQLDGAGGALIGFGGRARATAAATLEPGDALVFYTDGLIERRDRALRAGLAALVDACERITATDAAGIGEELLARLAEAPEDDVAVVVVRVPDPNADSGAQSTSPRSRRWLLPSEPASIGRARHAVLRTCQAWEIDNAANAELVVSELVANGVLHGWGHISLRLFDTGDGLRIEVEDSNPSPPVTTEGHANRVGGYGMQIVERLAEWGWRPSGSGKLVWAKVRPAARIDGGPSD